MLDCKLFFLYVKSTKNGTLYETNDNKIEQLVVALGNPFSVTPYLYKSFTPWMHCIHGVSISGAVYQLTAPFFIILEIKT